MIIASVRPEATDDEPHWTAETIYREVVPAAAKVAAALESMEQLIRTSLDESHP